MASFSYIYFGMKHHVDLMQYLTYAIDFVAMWMNRAVVYKMLFSVLEIENMDSKFKHIVDHTDAKFAQQKSGKI